MIQVRRLTHNDIETHIDQIAQLRIEIFKEFPYVYDGSIDYEVKYLRKYLDSEKAALIAAFEADQVVGIASCLPLQDEAESVKFPFLETPFNIAEIFYFGESVLKNQYRGQGLGKVFFKERESWARSFVTTENKKQFQITAFCAVDRPENHPLRPKGYQPLNEFWKKQGYQPFPQIKAKMSWQDINEKVETEKSLSFWIKDWSRE